MISDDAFLTAIFLGFVTLLILMLFWNVLCSSRKKRRRMAESGRGLGDAGNGGDMNFADSGDHGGGADGGGGDGGGGD